MEGRVCHCGIFSTLSIRLSPWLWGRESWALKNWGGERPLSFQYLVRCFTFCLYVVHIPVFWEVLYCHNVIYRIWVKSILWCGGSRNCFHFLLVFIFWNAADSVIVTGCFSLFVNFAVFPAVSQFLPAFFSTKGWIIEGKTILQVWLYIWHPITTSWVIIRPWLQGSQAQGW